VELHLQELAAQSVYIHQLNQAAVPPAVSAVQAAPRPRLLVEVAAVQEDIQVQPAVLEETLVLLQTETTQLHTQQTDIQ
jgi:hypothetical protein